MNMKREAPPVLRRRKKVAFNTKNTMSFHEFAVGVERGHSSGLGIADWVLLSGDELCEEDFAMMRTMDASDAEDLPLLEEEEQEERERDAFLKYEEFEDAQDSCNCYKKAEPFERGRHVFGADDYDMAEEDDHAGADHINLILKVEAFVDLYWSEEADVWERSLVNYKRAQQWNQIVHDDFQRSKKRTRKPRVRARMLRRVNEEGGRLAYAGTYTPSEYVIQRPQYQSQDAGLERAIAASMREAVNLTVRESLRVAARPTETVLPCGLTPQQIHDLTTREMTPEDYELLLLLDEQIKPKTVSQAMIDGYEHSTVTEESLGQMTTGDDDRCMVCLTEYCSGEDLIVLPCKHYFHAECITHWLTASSTKCPLDGLSLLEE